MNKKYLNNFLKKYYNVDFNKLLNCEDEFWRLDDETKETLCNINKNEHIQTLYSKRCNFNTASTSNDSYLRFAFTKIVENTILNDFIIEYYKKFNDNEHLSPHQLNVKFTNLNSNPKKIDLGCLNDKNYFNVNHLQVNYTNDNKERHEIFWRFLEDFLSKVNPPKT